MSARVWHEISNDAAGITASGGQLMDEYRRSDESGSAPREHATARKDRGGNAQLIVPAAYRLAPRSTWSMPRAGARPINLERRARFARFDVV
jgi:hypothetical protein